MITTANYLNALIRDRDAYKQKLEDCQIQITNLTFTKMNEELEKVEWLS